MKPKNDYLSTDIEIIRIRENRKDTTSTDSGSDNKSSDTGFFKILVAVLMTILLILIGYLLCLKAGWVSPVTEDCCGETLDLDFDFSR